MKNLSLKGLFMVAALHSLPALAADQRDFVFDKGTVYVRFSDIEKPYELKVTPSAGCKAKVAIKEDRDTVRVVHDQQPCPSGSIFNLVIKKGTSTEIRLAGGVVNVLDTLTLMTQVAKIDAEVSGGVIESEVGGFQNIGEPGMPHLVYENRTEKLDVVVKVRVNGGVVQFKR